MILFELQCPSGHRFEGWFRGGDAFEAQAASGEIACSVCGDTQVSKAPMAPRLMRGSEARAHDVAVEARKLLVGMREAVEKNCDFVGDNFAEEARKIHYGEAEERGIYGQATDDQAAGLREEGIDIARIPWIPASDA